MQNADGSPPSALFFLCAFAYQLALELQTPSAHSMPNIIRIYTLCF